MVFNSLTFVVFFALVLALHSLPLAWKTKKINLLVASYVFYAAWNPPFILLLWISTVVDWYAAQKLVRAEGQAARRAWMLVSVVANLGMLSYFKYGTFVLENFAALMAGMGIAYVPPGYDIVLPVGISFYTFATMSYTLDIYLRRAQPARNFLDYALFVTFFPHLVAGPIMRPTELVPQFVEPRKATPPAKSRPSSRNSAAPPSAPPRSAPAPSGWTPNSKSGACGLWVPLPIWSSMPVTKRCARTASCSTARCSSPWASAPMDAVAFWA